MRYKEFYEYFKWSYRQVKKWKSKHSEMSEELLIRYVYLDLAKRLSFNQNFRPFSNGKEREKIYKTISG